MNKTMRLKKKKAECQVGAPTCLFLSTDSCFLFILHPGPDNWPAYCTRGKKQSPIDFNLTGNEVVRVDKLKFDHYGDIPASSYFLNNGTGVKFYPKGVKAMKLPQVSEMSCIAMTNCFIEITFLCLYVVLAMSGKKVNIFVARQVEFIVYLTTGLTPVFSTTTNMVLCRLRCLHMKHMSFYAYDVCTAAAVICLRIIFLNLCYRYKLCSSKDS
jgi:hypothetical protein